MSEKQPTKEMGWAERCSFKLDMVLSRLDSIISMLFHTKSVLTADEAAMYLGVTTGHLYRMVRKHDIPHSRPTNGKIYFQKADLEKWIKTKADIQNDGLTNDMSDMEEINGTADRQNEAEPPMTEMYIN